MNTSQTYDESILDEFTQENRIILSSPVFLNDYLQINSNGKDGLPNKEPFGLRDNMNPINIRS